MAGTRISRRKLAAYYAEQLLAGRRTIAQELAAFLVETRRTRELELIVRDIEAALLVRGVLLADAASSRSLSGDAKAAITKFLENTTGAKSIHLRESTDPALLGGVRLSIPGAELDATVRYRLNQLKASKI